jgi:Na+/H+ antiporter NhaD/arsenite permease-like protein
LRFIAASFILFFFILGTERLNAEETKPGATVKVQRPAWAEDESPKGIRGQLSSGKLKVADREFNVIPMDAAELDLYEGQEVQLQGYRGSLNGAPTIQATTAPQILVPAAWSIPFLLLLACIACFPFINKHFWEHHYHHIAMGMGLLVVVLYAIALSHYGRHKMFETLLEYLKFMALVGSLFVVTGGILIEISGEGRPLLNTAILGVGAVLANLFGTTGASALLIRPFIRINKERIRPFHVVFFIFIVSNCGGALTPIGDPPLFLGYLYGVPFSWTIVNCWPAWLFTVSVLLAVFFLFDKYGTQKPTSTERTRITISGATNFVCLAVVLLGVFLDKILGAYVSKSLEAYPLGALLMVVAAAAAYKLSKPENLARNEFNFGPIKEVGYLFIGIFATMVPALDYLAANAEKLGVTTPGGFYFASGALSSFLDNAPTYLNFLTAAFGLKGLSVDRDMHQFIAQHPQYLIAVSLGSVFFGACTYIGNGPNFMVKAIAETSGAPAPSFFGYIFKYTPILLIIYSIVWLLFL